MSAMATIVARIGTGSGTIPNSGASGVAGSTIVSGMRNAVVTQSAVPGRLLKNGRRVRMTSATINSVSSDSTNHPV